MKKTSKILTILLAIVLVAVAYWFLSSKTQTNKPVNNGEEQSQDIVMANPATEFCIKNGGTPGEVENTDGTIIVVCNFEEGKSCDETALFRNTCNLEGIINSVVYRNASGTEVFASYNLKTDKAYMSSLDLFMNNLELDHAVSGSGARYLSANGEVELWEHQGEGAVSVRGEEVFVGMVVPEELE